MHKLLYCLLLCCLTLRAGAQDVITKINGEQLEAHVLEVHPSEIKYQLLNDPDSILYGMATKDIRVIRYEDGTVDSMTREVTAVVFSGNPFAQGVKDARKYYKGYKSAGTATLIVSLLSPPGGLIPAVACSFTPPATPTLGYPSEELMRNPDYASGYRYKAARIKQGKVWMNWGIAVGVYVGAALAVLGAVHAINP